MRIHSTVCLFVLMGSLLAAPAFAQDPEPEPADPCNVFPAELDRYAQLRDTYFNGNIDLDGDGLPDRASLKLVQAVACLNSSSDMADATLNAYNMNLAVFDMEGVDSEDPDVIAAIEELAPYRTTIAMLMLISADLQSAVNARLDSVLTGTYERVQCSGDECTPDPVEDVSPQEMVNTLVAAPRDTDEPYSGTGDLDGDGTDNVTEWNNVVDQGGRTDDFVVAATSPERDGTEEIRTPGGGGGGGCFIATAAYGTPLAEEVEVLRTVRDTTLLASPAGMAFVDTYYRVSPALADVVAEHAALRAVVRAVLYPILFLVQHIWAMALLAGLVGAGFVSARRTTRVDA